MENKTQRNFSSAKRP